MCREEAQERDARVMVRSVVAVPADRWWVTAPLMNSAERQGGCGEGGWRSASGCGRSWPGRLLRW